MCVTDNNEDENSKTDMESVTLVASGYEFECPKCEEYVWVDFVPADEIVTCPQCKTKYWAGQAEHHYHF